MQFFGNYSSRKKTFYLKIMEFSKLKMRSNPPVYAFFYFWLICIQNYCREKIPIKKLKYLYHTVNSKSYLCTLNFFLFYYNYILHLADTQSK